MAKAGERGDRKRLLSGVRRIVVKLGTSLVTVPGEGLNRRRIGELAEELSGVREGGVEVVVVSSGAIGAGAARLGKKKPGETLPEKQAAAAVGQSELMRVYQECFAERGRLVAQILLTRHDFADRVRYLNARNTLMALLHAGVFPIVNENDTVAVEEIKFGDNDTLSALIANLCQADLLVILTDTGGFYRADPRRRGGAELVPLVEEITPELEALAGGRGTDTAQGGMVTKLQAGRIVTESGEIMVIADGRQKGTVRDILAGKEVGTLFVPRGERVASRKRWIAYTLRPQGTIVVDAGARRALAEGKKSLLPSGVVRREGTFSVGDPVSIRDEAGEEIGRGLTNYGWEDVEKIKGLKTNRIESVLGHEYYDEVVHRDNLVILSRGESRSQEKEP